MAVACKGAGREGRSLGDYIASLARLAMVRVRTILPGHGRPSTDPEGDIGRAKAAARALLAGKPAAVRHRGEEPGSQHDHICGAVAG